MLAIAQSGDIYHYLNWIPSESGPMVTHYGKIDKKIKDPDKFRYHHYEILSEIISTIDNEEPICSYSLDRNNLIFYTSYADVDNPDLFDWYQRQVADKILSETMDYFHYPLHNDSKKFLSIAVPKMIRQAFKHNMRELNARLNGISTGIFSAENGARHWFHADKLDSYLVWKIGKKKRDEILYINNNRLESYFSITRTTKKVKFNWQFGNKDAVSMICQYIENLANEKDQPQQPFNKIFIYSCNGKIQDIKDIENKGTNNIILLNPLSILKMTEEEKVNIYATLSLAETGNAFGNVDV
jgi:hypothetical protein